MDWSEIYGLPMFFFFSWQVLRLARECYDAAEREAKVALLIA